MCIAVENLAPGRARTKSLADQSSLSLNDELQPVKLNGKHSDDDTTFSLEADSRYHVSFKRVNVSHSGSTAKELRGDTGLGEQTEELPGHFIAKDDNRRAAVGLRARLSTASGSGRRRVAYPGAPRSMVSSENGWIDDGEELPSYVMTLRRYPRLFAARGERLVPAVWPRRVYSGVIPTRQRLRAHDADLAATTSATATSSNRKTFDNKSVTSTTPSTTASTIATTTTMTTTTTTTTKMSTTTEEKEDEEAAATVHNMRQLAVSSNDRKVFLLDVGPSEIGEFRDCCCVYYDFHAIYDTFVLHDCILLLFASI